MNERNDWLGIKGGGGGRVRRSGLLLLCTLLLALSCLLFPACSADEVPDPDTSTSDTPGSVPQALGVQCRADSDCIAGICLYSEYGPPFCTRECTDEGVPCTDGADTAGGNTLCVSYAEPPTPGTPAFKGTIDTFCVPRCNSLDSCEAANLNWEVCDTPKWLGDPIYPNLGTLKVCLAPSYQGKDPVDPSTCEWEKTIAPKFNSEANLCRSYCKYMDRCKALGVNADLKCCEWGCFNQMVQEGEKKDPWYDQVRCHLDTHAAYPDQGQLNSCSQPPIECCPNSAGCPHYPEDPTPPAAAQ